MATKPAAFSDLLPLRYRIERILSRSVGTATLHVFDEGLRQSPAVIKLRQLRDSQDKALFLRHCATVSELSHPSVAVPYTHGILDDAHGDCFGYTTRDFVPGVALSELALPLSEAAVIQASVQIASGLDALHRADLVHQDLKLENVIVRRSRAGSIDELSRCVLIDLDYRANGADSGEEINNVTLQYVPPELLEGGEADQRSDIYALGVLCYAALSGTLPFSGESIAQILQKQRVRGFQPLRQRRSDVSGRFATIVERMLDPHPENRPASMQDVLALLQDCGEESGVVILQSQAQGTIPFVGREKEIQSCLEQLGTGSNVSSVRIVGSPGAGVTTFLRELQDRLEAKGAHVLTAQPRSVSGRSLQEQLYGPAHKLARRTQPRDGTESATSSTDLLDDLFIAARERQVVLFVDNWNACDVGESTFLRRVVLQNGAHSEDGHAHMGACQVILGESDREHVNDRLDGHIDVTVELEPLRSGHVLELIDRGTSGSKLSETDCQRLVEVTGGHLGRIVAAIRQLATGAERGGVTSATLDAIIRAGLGTREDSHRKALALVEGPVGRAVAALAVWGSAISVEEWRRWLRELSPHAAEDDTQADVDRFVQDGREYVRSRHSHLAKGILEASPGDIRKLIVGTLVSRGRVDAQGSRPERAISLLRFVARLGHMPAEIHWPTCRALLVLLQHGRCSDVESAARVLERSSTSAWPRLFRRAAQVEGFSHRPDEVACPQGGAYQRYAPWIEARSLWKGRNQGQARAMLHKLVSDTGTAAASPWLLEDYGVVSAECGVIEDAQVARSELVRRIRAYGRRSSVAARRRRAILRAHHYRVVQRIRFAQRRFEESATLAERECELSREFGNLSRTAASLNNQGSSLLKAGDRERAIARLEECAVVREKLDDERGVVVILNNLAIAFSSIGRGANAIAVLNRARLIAARNGLDRHRHVSTLHLGTCYALRGQLREARKLFGRLTGSAIDGNIRAKALANLARVALDCWHLRQARHYAAQLEALIEEGKDLRREGSPLILQAELAWRTQDHELLESTASQLGGPEQAEYEALVACVNGDECSASARRRYSRAARLRLGGRQWARRKKGLREYSVGRLFRYSRRHGCAREALEWVILYYRQMSQSRVNVALGLRVLSEQREGHDDLQIELRAALVGALVAEERSREAWVLLEDAIRRFGRLEKKVARWERPTPRVAELYEPLRKAIGSRDDPGDSRRLSTSLRASAFGAMQGTNRVGATDGSILIDRLGLLLSSDAKSEKKLHGLLGVARDATGAQRALLIDRADGGHQVQACVTAGDENETGDLSWAVVSEVFRTGEASVYKDALTADELASHRSIAALKLRSLICVPVRSGEDTVGALYLDHQGIAGLFGEEHQGLLKLVAALIATVTSASKKDRVTGKWESELREAHRQLLRAERNRVAGQLLSGIAHDLKNLLAAIVARSQLLRQAAHDANSIRSLKAIDTAAQAGARLIEKIQHCSREHGTEEPEPVDLAVMAHETLDLLGPRLSGRRGKVGRGIEVSISAAPGAVVLAPPGEIREVLLNLCVNACDAMPEGGELAIGISVNEEDQQAILQVRDTGVGMSKDTRERLFEPFFTTKGKDGTGLGLAIVQSIVVRHAGSLSVESAEGEGTAFTVAMPLFASVEAPSHRVYEQ